MGLWNRFHNPMFNYNVFYMLLFHALSRDNTVLQQQTEQSAAIFIDNFA